MADVVRGPAAPGAEFEIFAARIERVAPEPEREHLEREIGLRIALFTLPALFNEVENLFGRVSNDLPSRFEVGLFDRIACRARGQHRSPETEREGSGAPLERIHRRNLLTDPPATQCDPARLLEARRERYGETSSARVRFFVVVLGGDSDQVLEAELEVERVPLGAVDRIRCCDHLDPPARIIERIRARAMRYLSQRPKGCLNLGRPVAATPERGESARERSGGDSAPLSGQDACGEPIPEDLP